MQIIPNYLGRFAVALTLAACAVPAPATAGPAADPKPADPESAVAFVEAYVALYRDEATPQRLADKLSACWDLDAVVADIFGADLPAAGTPGRVALRDKVGRLFGAVLADEPTRAALGQVKVLQPCGLVIGGDRAAVSFVASAPGKAVNNLFILRRHGADWRITDLANGAKAGRAGFVGGVRAAYQKARPDRTPDQFVDELLKELGQRKGR